jgi:hypothetical protein
VPGQNDAQNSTKPRSGRLSDIAAVTALILFVAGVSFRILGDLYFQVLRNEAVATLLGRWSAIAQSTAALMAAVWVSMGLLHYLSTGDFPPFVSRVLALGAMRQVRNLLRVDHPVSDSGGRVTKAPTNSEGGVPKPPSNQTLDHRRALLAYVRGAFRQDLLRAIDERYHTAASALQSQQFEKRVIRSLRWGEQARRRLQTEIDS